MCPCILLFSLFSYSQCGKAIGASSVVFGQKVTLSEKDSLEITRKALVNSLEKIEGFSPNSSPVWYSLPETVAKISA